MVVPVLVGALLLAACGGDRAPGGGSATGGFEPVRAGASGFAGGAPQPVGGGTLSVSKVVDGATFFGRVETPGGSGLPVGETQRFRLAGARAPGEGECLDGTSTRHLEGIIRGGRRITFVVGEEVDATEATGIPVHAWSRGIWINGEVLARGYGDLADPNDERHAFAEAARSFARDGAQGRWNPALCEEATSEPANDATATAGEGG